MIIITIEDGKVQEVYGDRPKELVLVRYFYHDEKDSNPRHALDVTLDLQDCDSAIWPDINMADLRKQEQDNKNEVELITSGYDWECPHCGYWNKELEIPLTVRCRKCHSIFNVSGCSYPEQEQK